MSRFPIILVGNKADLSKNRLVSYEEGKAMADSWGVKFFEVSSKLRCVRICLFKSIER